MAVKHKACVSSLPGKRAGYEYYLRAREIRLSGSRRLGRVKWSDGEASPARELEGCGVTHLCRASAKASNA